MIKVERPGVGDVIARGIQSSRDYPINVTLMDDPRRRLHYFDRQGADLVAIAAQSEFIDPRARHDDML